MGIRPSSTASFFVSEEEEEHCFVFVSCLCTARLIRIVRLARLSEAAKRQELFASPVSHCLSLIARLLLPILLLYLFCSICCSVCWSGLLYCG